VNLLITPATITYACDEQFPDLRNLTDEYFNHKEYYYLEVLIPAKDVTVEIIPLKHCYNIVMIPNHIVFPLEDWVDANVEVEDL
jgi:hypothetical protein